MSNDTRFSSSQAASRLGLIAGASALLLYGLSRRSKAGIALATAGGFVAYRQARANVQNPNQKAKAVFRVNASAADSYRLWRDFNNLPRFMAHLESVRVLDDRRSEWTANGPFASQVRWNAEITDDQPNGRIAWRSLPGSEIATSGSVEFQDDPQGRGSTVRVELGYSDPLGSLGRALLTALGKNPNFVVKEDLRRFKAFLEAGEAPTTEGQTHGPRGLQGRTRRALFREASNHPSPQAQNTPAA